MKKLYLILISFTFFPIANAVSFKCDENNNQIEQIICNDENLSSLDSEMANKYKIALNLSNDRIRTKQEQQNWLKNERNACEDSLCIKNSYLLRISTLTSSSEEPTNTSQATGSAPENIDSKQSSASIVPPLPTQGDQQNMSGTSAGQVNRSTAEIGRKTDLLSSAQIVTAPTTQPAPISPTADQEALNDPLKYLKIAAVVFTIGFIWNKFFRNRCPDCKSTNFEHLSSEETDRWRQAEKVQEKTSTGKIREKHVTFTYVKIKRSYKCKQCQNLWSITSTEKK